MNDLLEALGFLLVLAFLWFVWPPLVLLGAGILLVVGANTRKSGRGRIGAAVGAAVTAARRAYAAAEEQPTTELRRIA